jgi:copper chaperone
MVGIPIFPLPGKSAQAKELSMLTLNIPNMNCGGCARGVAAAIHQVDPAAQVEPDLQGRTVAVKSSAPEARLREALTEAGFAPA